MSDISEPIQDLPRSDSTPAALRDSQARALAVLRTAAGAVDAEAAALEANRDLSGPAASRRIAEARQRFVAEHEAAWLELRERGELARDLLAAYFSDDGVRARLMTLDLDETAAAIAVATGSDAQALYGMAAEAGRVSDPTLAAVLLVEARKRLAADTIGTGDAAAIANLCEQVPLPSAEVEARTALESAVVAGLEADLFYRAASTGLPADPVSRLQLERTRQAVTGESARREPPMAPDRLRAELDRQRAS